MCRTKIMARLLIATLLIPHVALGAITPRKAPERVAVSAEQLADLWGGVLPAAHIGGDYEYGLLVVSRSNFTCPFADYIGTPMVPPATANMTLKCNQSIPMFASGEDVLLWLGGNAANMQGYSNPHFTVYVNGVAVSPSQLGGNFQSSCPPIPDPWGTATVNAFLLTLYSCSSTNDPFGDNYAVIPHSLFRTGLNNITVTYSYSEIVIATSGNDVKTRTIYHQ
jgi:hypothetical protein